jgi:hypothetical protein
MITNDVVEFIGEGGFGSEAEVRIELRTQFPGLGGTIYTHEGVIAALRKEFNPAPKSGHKLFLKHLIIKKLDDYFYRRGVYVFSHIPRPFGSFSREDKNEAYLYEWAFGSEGFSWKSADHENNPCDVMLHDWNQFVSCFSSAGIDMLLDVADPEDGRVSKNIIHQFPKLSRDCMEMNSLWKRIDFGASSVHINWEELSKYFRDKQEDLIRILKSDRYEMLLLAIQYLMKGDAMNERDRGRLEVIVGYYRSANLSHFASGMGPATGPAFFGPSTESL